MVRALSKPITGAEVPALLAQEGQIIAERYEILRRVGAGGMGEVFEARHLSLDRIVAVKLARVVGASREETLRRLLQEAKLNAQLAGPYTAQVFDFGETDDGLVYFVMEFVAGESLRSILKRETALDLPRARVLMTELLTALAEVHAQGVAHRDLKPDNLLVSRDSLGRERLRLLDFGIARTFAEAVPAKPGSLGAGTAGYAAPEQAAGRGEDPRADLYSAAVIFYEMLCGRRPFQSEFEIAELTHQQTARPSAPSTHTPFALPAGLQAVMLRALSLDPQDRYPSAAELQRAIDEAVGAPTPPRPPGPLGRTGAWLDRLLGPLFTRGFWIELRNGGWRDWRHISSLAGGAVAAVLALFVLSSFLWPSAPPVASAPSPAMFAAPFPVPAPMFAPLSAPASIPEAPRAPDEMQRLFTAGDFPALFEAIRRAPSELRNVAPVQRLWVLAAAEIGRWRDVRPAYRAALSAGLLSSEEQQRIVRLASIALNGAAGKEARTFLSLELAALDALTSAAKDADARRRQQAVTGLLEIDSPGVDVVPSWMDALSNARDCQERVPLVEALLKRKDERSRASLAALRDDAGFLRANRCLKASFTRAKDWP
jgi:serine/threonine protein kinase